MSDITDQTRKIIIRALNREMGRWVSKLETGHFFNCRFAVERRDAAYMALIEMGDTPAFLIERCKKLHSAFPFIPDLPSLETVEAAA